MSTKPDHWFSRRHETNEAHIAANVGRNRRATKERKRAQAEARNAVAEAQMRHCGHVHGVNVVCENPS